MNQTVLLVDDEPDILHLLEIALARMNLNTLSAKSLTEALQILAHHEPDLCLTDMRLPDGNGLQLVEHVQQLERELPVAVITAHGSVEAAIDALKLGAFDFVSKPVALDKLREKDLSQVRCTTNKGSLRRQRAAHCSLTRWQTYLLPPK